MFADTPDPLSPDSPATSPSPDPLTAHVDREAFQDAHGRTGRMLQSAGLPFEPEELEDDDSESSSDGDSTSSEGDDSSDSSAV